MPRPVGRCRGQQAAIRRLLVGREVRWVAVGLPRRWRRVEPRFVLPVQLPGWQVEPPQAAVGRVLLLLSLALPPALSQLQVASLLPLLRGCVRSVLELLVP